MQVIVLLSDHVLLLLNTAIENLTERLKPVPNPVRKMRSFNTTTGSVTSLTRPVVALEFYPLFVTKQQARRALQPSGI